MEHRQGLLGPRSADITTFNAAIMTLSRSIEMKSPALPVPRADCRGVIDRHTIRVVVIKFTATLLDGRDNF